MSTRQLRTGRPFVPRSTCPKHTATLEEPLGFIFCYTVAAAYHNLFPTTKFPTRIPAACFLQPSMIQAIRLFLLVRIQEFFMPLLICHTARSYLRIKAFSPYNPYGVFWRLQRDNLLHPREKYQTVETKFSNKRGRGVYCLIARSVLKPWNSSKEIISLYELIMCKSYILPDALNTSASSVL